MERFLRHRFGGLIFGGAYTWRDLFSEFYGVVVRLFGFSPAFVSLVNSSFKQCSYYTG